MKCWNSAFNAQGSRVIYSSCTGESNENICWSTGGAQERGDQTQFTTNVGGKACSGPSYLVL